MGFKIILVPHDGSIISDKALDKAVEIAKLAKGSQIIIIHVIPEIPTPIFSREIRSPKTGEVITFSEYMISLYQEIESEMREKLEDKKKKYSLEDGMLIEIYITIGNPSDKILEYATDKKADLIVIGSIGITGVSKFFKGLGSVSRNVSEKVSCPVLIVR
ncbi:MAG TPA: universal stress protein [Nitrososphaeraceae archaeon]|jgi:nucleotide-binding universal stress UspA family protein|nr:universal stress protein [Nitrososphaeraceae archaeon]